MLETCCFTTLQSQFRDVWWNPEDGETPVAGLIGASASSVTIPVTTIAAARKIPQISPSSTALALSNKESWPKISEIPEDLKKKGLSHTPGPC